jgi:hypothetical protein
MDQQVTIIVTSAVAASLRNLAARVGKGYADGMFTTPLSATGALPATHYISAGRIKPAFINAITDPTRLFTIAKRAYEDDGDVFPFTQAQVTNALSKCTIVTGEDERPIETLARLGLQIIQQDS